MKILKQSVAIVAICAATVAVAKEGVKNEAVKARQAAMGTLGAQMKTLGGMAKGAVAFDAAAATAAVATIKESASMVPALFEAEETDPLTEAKPEIWMKWDEFTAKSDALVKAAESVDVSTLDGVKAALGQLGGTCQSCHEQFRI